MYPQLKQTLKWVALIPLVTLLIGVTPTTFAARYTLSDNNNLVKGCSGTIEIKVNTEGAQVIAGDTTIGINPGELTVNQLDIGSVLPMQVFNQFTPNEIKLSGARLPLTGNFSGTGTFGYVNFTPSLNANSGSFSFSQNLQIDNNMIDENITNVLDAAVSKTYNFNDRYNIEVDGVGFCTPDSAAPNVQFVSPPAGSSNNPVDTNIIFAISDNRAGVDISTLDFTIGGVDYDQNSAQVSVTLDAETYRVETDPDVDFEEGDIVALSVSICDSNTPANCTTRNTTFAIFSPAPAPAVCGDGIVQPANGEQCDDANNDSGDGCSAICLLEVAPPPESAAQSCSDGIHNQGEAAIDCGGPCPNACPTCVDGKVNQGEESVDCGGPCTPCDIFQRLEELEAGVPVIHAAAPEVEECVIPEDLITICHIDPDNPDVFYSLAIPEYSLEEYQANGDTIGPCVVEDLILPVAAEVEEAAFEEAQVVEEAKETKEKLTKVVQLPEAQQALSQIELCRQNSRYSEVDFRDPAAITDFDPANPPSFDFDGDGLSNRTECYLETDPTKSDTDGDSCLDGDELNQFDSDPTTPGDCSVVLEDELGFNQVLVTDPKPGWTLGTQQPRIAGVTPVGTKAVTLTAFHADQKIVRALIAAVNGILQARDGNTVAEHLAALEGSLLNAQKFLDDNAFDFDYLDLEKVVEKLKKQATTLRERVDASAGFALRTHYENLQELAFGSTLIELGVLQREPIVIGSTSSLSETILADQEARSFEFVPEGEMDDQKLFNIVATSTIGDRKLSSDPIRFGVNTGFTISKPVPRTLGGKLISGEISYDGNFFYNAKAQEDGRVELEIEEDRPTVTGDTEFGSQVFAIWNSVVLSSSVISDSEKGSFEIQAPRNLERDTHHRVTLYAVKTSGESTLRSESVDVFFAIKSPKASIVPVVAASGGLLGLAIIYFVIRRIQLSRSALRLLKIRKK